MSVAATPQNRPPRHHSAGVGPSFRPWLVTALGLVLLLILGLVRQAASHTASPPLDETQVKAVYLYNFLNFVSWPGQDAAAKASPMRIGIVGDAAMAKAVLEVNAELESMGKPTVQVQSVAHFSQGQDLSACHILFIGGGEKEDTPTILASLHRRPVLTVSDAESFLEAGGMIAISEHQKRIRYRINRRAATAAGLHLNAQLLNSAVEVRDE